MLIILFLDMRGIAILAVILIHSTSAGLEFKGIDNLQYNYTIILRQLINFVVPIIFFISGYFTNQAKAVEDSGQFFK